MPQLYVAKDERITIRELIEGAGGSSPAESGRGEAGVRIDVR
jgi:hypothetical protein